MKVKRINNFSFTSHVIKIACAVMILLCLSNTGLRAQDKSAQEYQVKAVFLYNFTHFIDWPASAFTSQNSAFVIGIIGEDPFSTYLEEVVEGEFISGHVIVIRHFQSAKDINNCHILFINYNDAAHIKEIINDIPNKNILTVGDAENFVKWGGMIRLYTEENKIRIQINAAAAKGAQLNISSKLLNVAQVY